MKIVLFCENKYAIDILKPIHDEALREEVEWTSSIQEIYDFHPEAVFVPGNIVPYYLSGVKIQVFVTTAYWRCHHDSVKYVHSYRCDFHRTARVNHLLGRPCTR